jgi:hypothetical protein
MGQDDITTDHSQTTRDHGHDVSGIASTVARGGLHRQGEPLFKRFAVAKEWRTKDGAVG